MMFPNFNIAEFVRRRGEVPEVIPTSVADKIIRKHMTPLQIVRSELGVPIHITSGYRPISWEVTQGRSGKSQHTFEGNGAVDVSLFRNTHKWEEFSNLIRQHYKRIAWYPIQNFMHLDHHGTETRFFLVRYNEWIHVTQKQFRDNL